MPSCHQLWWTQCCALPIGLCHLNPWNCTNSSPYQGKFCQAVKHSEVSWARLQVAEEAHTDRAGRVASMSHSREDGKNTPIHQSTVYNDIQGGVSWGGESSHCSEMSCSLLLESRTCQIYPVPFSTRMYNHGLLLKQKSYKNVMGKLGERQGYRNVSTS